PQLGRPAQGEQRPDPAPELALAADGAGRPLLQYRAERGPAGGPRLRQRRHRATLEQPAGLAGTGTGRPGLPALAAARRAAARRGWRTPAPAAGRPPAAAAGTGGAPRPGA